MNAFMSYKFSTKNLILNGNCNHDDDDNDDNDDNDNVDNDDDNKQKNFFFNNI